MRFASICLLATELMIMGSEFAAQICKACAEANPKCGDERSKYEHFMKYTEACYSCAGKYKNSSLTD